MVTVDIPKNDIVGVECKHVAYQEATDWSKDDLLLVKEVVHLKDKTTVDRIRLIENFKRPIYVTRPPYRNHRDKKEYEELEKLQRYDCTQSRMSETIQRALGKSVPNPKLQLRMACDNPYVYFADLSSSTIVKAAYKKKAPDLASRSKLAVLDIETDVVFGTNEPIMVSVTMGERKIIAIAEWFAKKVPNFADELREKYKYYMSSVDLRETDPDTDITSMVNHNLYEERGGDITIITHLPIGAGFQKVMTEVHAWYPDFLAVWNLDFDMPKLLAALKKESIPYEDVFTDPCVPDKYRNVWYYQAKAQRETNSKTIAQHPADLWHILYCMAGFYVIDAMCAFKKIRTANGNEPDYKLGNVLMRYLGIGKLNFHLVDAADGTLEWHIQMQTHYPVEYAVYCMFDCIGVELLDEKTNDLALVVPVLAGISSYTIFPSLPKRLVDNLHYFYLEQNLIAGCVGKGGETELDEDVIDLTKWIVTLSAYAVERNGLQCVAEIPKLVTSFHNQTGDEDIEQAYPTGELIGNVSKETTAIELKSVDGVSEDVRRRAGINLTGGATNAIEISTEFLLLPDMDDMLEVFKADIKEGLI